MESVWSEFFPYTRPGSTKLKWFRAAKCAGPSFIIYGKDPAKPLASTAKRDRETDSHPDTSGDVKLWLAPRRLLPTPHRVNTLSECEGSSFLLHRETIFVLPPPQDLPLALELSSGMNS